jgi:hypothetical protein
MYTYYTVLLHSIGKFTKESNNKIIIMSYSNTRVKNLIIKETGYKKGER